MRAHDILEALVADLLDGFGLLNALRGGLTYLPANARRANPNRDLSLLKTRNALSPLRLAAQIDRFADPDGRVRRGQAVNRLLACGAGTRPAGTERLGGIACFPGLAPETALLH